MRDIVQIHVLPFPQEMVWAALTESEQLAAWLMPNDFRAELGHRFTFRTDPAPGFDGIVQCEVLRLDPPRELAFSWRGGPLDTVVSFLLEPVAGGTRVTLRHAGFRGAGNLIPRIVLGFGWGRLLRRKLPAALASR